MGEDKALLPFDGYDTLIEYQYTKLSKMFQKVYISSKIKKFSFEANIILDNNSEFSPMVALESILKIIPNEKVFIITVDTPFIQQKTIHSLISKSKKDTITIAQTPHKTHNLCGVFPKSLLISIQKCLKKDIHKINYLIHQNSFNTLEFFDENEFLNLNTPQEYQTSREYYKLYK